MATTAQVPKRNYGQLHGFRVQDQWMEPDSQRNPRRLRALTAHSAGTYAGSMLYLGTAWYAGQDLERFHFFNDWHQWQQMDKVGHMWSTYHCSRGFIDLHKWAGVDKKTALWRGGLYGWLAVSSIEVFDGFGESWGFSWSDIGANSVGAGLAVLNEGLWNEERLQLKMSYLPSSYAGDTAFTDLFGSHWSQWPVKDYNGQVHWLSVRVHSFLPAGKFRDHYPRWLNLAIGYGANGLEGGYDDPDRAYLEREYRQLYLSLDIDLANIQTRIGWLHTLFQVVNMVRIPLPAIRFDRYGVGMEAVR